MSKVVLSSTYAGSIAHYSILSGASEVITEVNDNYSRQTFRTRCRILGPNGVETLTIPVIKPQEKTIVKDIVIDGTQWQTQHIRAIETAYNSSPFLEYYIDDLMPFYTKVYKWLYDFNMELEDKLCSLIGISFKRHISDSYLSYPDKADYRFLIDKKGNLTESFTAEPYYQVFKEKFGFVENLSVLDLLMNMGPESILVLKK
ncbi:MAG: WbqC family protein [Paludibacteraceae bacterium]|nr:WbqC family protein [Paludibacteraceae bacterium]